MKGQIVTTSIDLSEVEYWLKEQIKPYLARIQVLEDSEKIKDAKIHSLQLALVSIKMLLSTAQPALKPICGTRPQTAAIQGGHKKLTITLTPEDTNKEETPKKVVRPTTSKPSEKHSITMLVEDGDDKKSAKATGSRANTARFSGALIKPKKDEVTGENDKKSEGESKKEDKKPMTSTLSRILTAKKPVEKKEEVASDKDDKKPIKPVVEKKPVNTPTPKVTKKEPDVKKDENTKINGSTVKATEVKKDELKNTITKHVEPKKDEQAKSTHTTKHVYPKKDTFKGKAVVKTQVATKDPATSQPTEPEKGDDSKPADTRVSEQTNEETKSSKATITSETVAEEFSSETAIQPVFVEVESSSEKASAKVEVYEETM